MGAARAAAGCARPLGRDTERIRHATGQAATLGLATSWTACFEGATGRNLYAGTAGAVGLRAALAAEAGFTAPARPLRETFGRLPSAAEVGRTLRRLAAVRPAHGKAGAA